MRRQSILAFKSSTRTISTNRFPVCSQAKVGFIGLGNMGGPMAINLAKKGNELIVYDTSQEALDALEKHEGTSNVSFASSPASVAESADRIITMLPNSHHVQQCYQDQTQGIFKAMKPGTLLIDSSTIAPNVSQEIAAAAQKLGAAFLDAPVSGGVNAAKAATLTFMVGGSESEFEAARVLLESMGKNVVYCGRVGSGQAAKICNNMLLAISMIGTAETMNLGMRLGLDPKLLAGILNSSSGRCWSCDTYNPVPGVMTNVPSSNDYEGGFGVSLMTKDMGLAQEAATNTQTPTPMGSLAHQLYRLMTGSGYGRKDFSSVFQFLREQDQSNST